MGNLQRAEQLLRELLQTSCPELQVERKGDKILFYCGSELKGSAVRLDEERTAATVYTERMGDPLIGEFVRRVQERFGGAVLERGTKPSGGIEGSFYYTYVHLKESKS